MSVDDEREHLGAVGRWGARRRDDSTPAPVANVDHGATTLLPRRATRSRTIVLTSVLLLGPISEVRVDPDERRLVRDGVEHLVDGRRGDRVGARVLADVVRAERHDPQFVRVIVGSRLR